MNKLNLENPRLPPGLNYSKSLRIEVHEFSQQNYDEDMNDEYGEFLARVIRSMPRLQHFTYVAHSATPETGN